MTGRIVEGTTLTDQLVRLIRDGISRGDLRPHELYSVNRIAEKYDVSRTPAREALVRLAEAGMVKFERNRGFVILGSMPKDIAEVFQLRLLLEPPAASLAAQATDRGFVLRLKQELTEMHAAAHTENEPRFMEHDKSFHAVLLGAAGNQRLVDVVSGLRDMTITMGASTIERSRSLADVADEHVPILEAVEHKDSEAATSAMHTHLERTGRLLLAQAAENGLDGLPPSLKRSVDKWSTKS